MRLFFHKFSNGNIQTYELGCGTAVSLFDNSYNLYYPTSYEFISIKASKWERRFSKNYFCSEEISLFLLTPPAASDWIMSLPRLIVGQKQLLLEKKWLTHGDSSISVVKPARLRAESARAFTGRRNSHSGRGEDFLTGQPDFLRKQL